MVGQPDDQLYALVDMGSNGIRFSISSLAAPMTRSLPTVYQSRLGISLYDAQFEDGRKVPIPSDVVARILSELKRFRETTIDFGVPQKAQNVRILATEATRNASNSAEFIQNIESTLGEPWKVNILAKEDEGRIGALGVVSSVGGSAGLQGLMMDLGGGSTQLTWLLAKPGEKMSTSPLGSISFPYGAAAMTRLLSETTSDQGRSDLRARIVQEFTDAYHQLALPQGLRDEARSHGLTLYLSGGGFRGWGYLLMSSHHIRPYPIPIINGFTVPVKSFKDTAHVSLLARNSLSDQEKDGLGVFRVSKRRAAQVPAVSFLVDALIEAIPAVKKVRFCQGGVREGWLFDQLSANDRAEDPLVAASSKYALHLPSAAHFAELLSSALPADDTILDRSLPSSIRDPFLIRAYANLLFLQQGHSKESASLNALSAPLTGVLANAHGVGHEQRALLALMLGQRWGGADQLPAPHSDTRARLELLLTQQEIWWGRYLAVIGICIGEIYPAGRMRDDLQRVQLNAKWCTGLGKKGNQQGICLTFKVNSKARESLPNNLVKDLVESIEDAGKKKNRVGGKEYGFGVPIRVNVEHT